jgi:membrane AbrB-like protein
VPGRGRQGVAVSSTTAGPRERRWRTLVAAVVRYGALLSSTLLGWWLFSRIGLAAPDLFAALAAAIVFAVAGIGPARPTRPIVMLSQSMLAVTIGLSVQRETLTALGANWPAVVTVAVATLVLSVLAGFALSLHRDVDAVTGVLGMIAGGATGLVAAATELGADERTVVVAQYLRVALVVLTMPLVVTYAFALDASRSPHSVIDGAAHTSWWARVAVHGRRNRRRYGRGDAGPAANPRDTQTARTLRRSRTGRLGGRRRCLAGSHAGRV